MRTGISSWAFPWAIGVENYPAPTTPLTAPDLLAKASALKVGAVQIADNLPLERLNSVQLRELRKQAERSGLVLEAGTRGVEPAHLRRYLEIARSIGARLVRTLTHTAESRPTLKQAESWLREALPEFAYSGVSIGLENYERHTAAELAALVERVGSDHLGVCLDTVNSLGALENLEQVIQILAPHVINVHVKDFEIERIDTRMGYSVKGCPAGEGRLNIPRVLEQIDRYGRRPNLILEQWTPFTGSVERTLALEAQWAERGVRFLKSCEARPETMDSG